MNKNLEETYYFNFNNQIIQDFLHKNLGNAKDEIGKAVAIYYAVRDLIKYDPYHIILKKEHLQASETAKRGYGYCVEKASLLTTLARAVGIPAKIGFANVKNHINSKRLYNLMKTDVFVYHGYTEMFLNGKWIKCTPAFNKSLCDRAGILTLEFNGKENSMFHPIDTRGQKHMEY
jgi:transglutaminase-like putative cysteine protease